MDDTLRLIQHLYDEETDDPTFEQRLAEDETLRREYEQLLDTKEALEQRSSSAPDPGVVDDLVDQAAEAAPSPSRSDSSTEGRTDRAARSPARSKTRRLQGVGGILALLLVAAVGWWQMDNVQTPSAATSSVSAQQSVETVTEGTQEDEEVPAWDDRDEVVRLHRNIEMVQGRSRDDPWESMTQSVDRAGP